MSMFFGNQYAERVRGATSEGLREKLVTPKTPYYKRRKTVNMTRAFVRAEHAKFLSSIPSMVAVPSTAEDDDVRMAYAGQQVWESVSATRKMRAAYRKSSFWTILTGVGFVKTWWNPDVVYNAEMNQMGDISFGSVTPFHLFVPDLREEEIEDQPFIINAYTKTVEWCKHFYGKELDGVDLQASTSSPNSILEEGYLNLSTAGKPTDSVTVYEAWVKPGATSLLPEGGVVILIDRTIVGLLRDGLPYRHGMYPFTKFEHIPNGTFYADSPLVDTNELQKEYNELRSDISYAGKIAARPQLLAQKGSIVVSKVTNEAGLVIEYKPGTPPPTPMPLSPLPQYYVDQQVVIQSDWENITGQREVSQGVAPTGITSGTAINYLQEKANQFLTPQYDSIELGHEKIAISTIGLFVQFVDVPRQIKTIGSDSSFDTMLLSGSDVKNGTDLRVQKGSSIGVSQAAKDARVMDMFATGIITDPNMALKLLEVGGADKILDIMNIAEQKAQRENSKMKLLKPEMIEMWQMQQDQMAPAPMDPMAEAPLDGPDFGLDGAYGPPPAQPEPMVPVADFDVHELHVEVHNRFRMGQEYEALPPQVQEQFDLHVKAHEMAVMESQMAAQFADGSGNALAPEDMEPEVGPEGDPTGTMSPTGAESAPPMEGI